MLIVKTLIHRAFHNFSDILKAHIDGKFEECMKKIEKSKCSILYDLNQKIGELKTTFVQSSAATCHKESEARKTFGTALPIKILEEFIEFDTQLIEQKRDSFVSKTQKRYLSE